MSSNRVVLSPGIGEKGIVPAKYFRTVFEPSTKKVLYSQPFDYLCVYDFECNCVKDRAEPLEFNEIVEFPVVIIDVKNKKIAGEFHTYIRPTLEKEVKPFCTELTGITNERCFAEGVPTLEEALAKLHNFLLDFGMFQKEFVFMSCGDFDGNQMAREAQRKNISVPNYLKRWINLKKVFPKDATNKSFRADSDAWTTIGQEAKAKPSGGMTAMLNALQIPLEGRHHSGIDDARNLAKIVIAMLDRDFEFNQAMVNNKKY